MPSSNASGETQRSDSVDEPKVDTEVRHSVSSDLSLSGQGTTKQKGEKKEGGCAADWISDALLVLSENINTIIPKGTWESMGSEEEIAEENGYTTKKRPQVRVQFEVRRDLLINQRMVHTSYLTKEASEDSRDQRSTKNTMYEVARSELNIGVQAVIPTSINTSQTPFFRKVDASFQAEPTLVDARIRNIALPKKEAPNMMTFLDKALPRVLHCLLQNHAVPIYQDDFSLFTEEDVLVGSRDDTILIERGNYTHASMKELKVTSISWRSSRTKDDYVCIASIANHSFEERIEAERRCETSLSLVWDFADPMHPRCLLEAPVEIQVLRFNPLKPNLIAGGGMNGQVFLWDMNHVAGAHVGFLPQGGEKPMAEVQDVTHRLDLGAKDIPPMPQSVKGLTMERDGDAMVPRLQPIQSSRVELSHKRAVHAIQWMPNGLECAFDGKQTVTSEGRQFVSLSDDGYICIWDIRPEHLPADRLRKMKHQGRVGGEEFPWVPFLRFQLSHPGGAGNGDLMGFRFYVDGMQANDSPSYRACCGTTSGEVSFCNMLTPDERREFVPSSEDARCVRQAMHGHAGPVYSVERHPTITDVYLTCGDLQFKLWRVGVNEPIFTSPQHDSVITCASWSPTRVSVILVGTIDGKILVWDLLDRNREPLLVHQLVQDAITVIKFKPAPATITPQYVQHVAMGTMVGSFHWYALPRVLTRGPSGEQRHFRSMLEREVRRVHYYTWRWSERERERDRYGVAVPRLLAKPSSGVLGDGTSERVDCAHGINDLLDDFYAYDNYRDAEFLEKVRRPLPEAERMELDMDPVIEEGSATAE